MNYIEKLRKKPARVRRAIVLISAFFITGIIFIVWLTRWNVLLNPQIIDTGDTASSTSDITDPVFLAKDNWQNFRDTFSDGFAELKNQIRF